MVKIDDQTGEVIETVDTNSVKYQLALSELKQLAVFGEWLEKKEAYLTAKEQFEMVDKPFRKTMGELFDRYSLRRLTNEYIDIVSKNGYEKKNWDNEKLEEYLISQGLNPDTFKKSTWVNGTLQIKYKE